MATTGSAHHNTDSQSLLELDRWQALDHSIDPEQYVSVHNEAADQPPHGGVWDHIAWLAPAPNNKNERER